MILEEFDKGLAMFKVMTDMYQQIILVLSSCSDCYSANDIPSIFFWFACYDNKLVTVLTTVVNKKTKMYRGVRSKPFYQNKYVQHMLALFMLIDAFKNLTTYYNTQILRSELSKTLKQ